MHCSKRGHHSTTIGIGPTVLFSIECERDQDRARRSSDRNDNMRPIAREVGHIGDRNTHDCSNACPNSDSNCASVH
jgi:hypothetical protein